MTKIEAIAVVAGIGILGAILLPFLQQKHTGPVRRPPCQCNLIQLTTAAAFYEGDNAGVRPGPQPMGVGIPEVSWDRPLALWNGANLGKAGVYKPLDSLTKALLPRDAVLSLASFSCPTDALRKGARSVPVTSGSFADGTAAGKGICRSYVMSLGTGNLVAGTDDGITPTANAVPAKKIESAAGTVYLIESHGYATVFGQRSIANDTYMICDKTGAVNPKDAFTNPLAPMHGAKTKPQVNALMYDGHVEALDPETITANGGKIMQYVK
jgi:prepilin-type processing-associated H-X9-DG protein